MVLLFEGLADLVELPTFNRSVAFHHYFLRATFGDIQRLCEFVAFTVIGLEERLRFTLGNRIQGLPSGLHCTLTGTFGEVLFVIQ